MTSLFFLLEVLCFILEVRGLSSVLQIVVRLHSTQRTVHTPYGHIQHSAQYTHHSVTLKTAHSTHTIRSHSTQCTVHTPYGHTQQSEQYTHHTVTLNTAHSTHTKLSHSTQRTVHTPYGHTQHSAQYTHHTYDMLPHHRITYNDVVFFFYRILI